MRLKVVDQDGTCTQSGKGIPPYYAYPSNNFLGCKDCNDASVDYIIHSMTQVDGTTFTAN